MVLLKYIHITAEFFKIYENTWIKVKMNSDANDDIC